MYVGWSVLLVDGGQAVAVVDGQHAQDGLSGVDPSSRILRPNHFNTEFGVTNVKLHRIATALDLGDAGEALDVARSTDPTNMSSERQMRFQLDIARAHAQRRQIGAAVEALSVAASIHPETFRSHHLTLQTVEDLIPLAAGPDLARLNDMARHIGSRS